jgi:hypothetical protein
VIKPKVEEKKDDVKLVSSNPIVAKKDNEPPKVTATPATVAPAKATPTVAAPVKAVQNPTSPVKAAPTPVAPAKPTSTPAPAVA